MPRINIYKPGKRMLMPVILPHLLFHCLKVSMIVCIRNICTVGARTRGRSSCKVSLTATDLQEELGDANKTSSNAQYETARNSSGYTDVAQ